MSQLQIRLTASLATLASVCLLSEATFAQPVQQASSQRSSIAAQADDRDDGPNFKAIVPLVRGWYKGRIALYVSTDASDPAAAQATHTNFVPKLGGAIVGSPTPVDDIYQLTNFKQGNIIPSAPHPAGPANNDPSYTPLWQLSLVTWSAGSVPHVLRSEEAVLAARASGFVTIRKTNIVINCPVVFTPSGGLLNGVRIIRADDR